MDLNYLFHRQQVERSRAEAANSQEARQAHLILACEYEREIERMSGGRISFAHRPGNCSSEPLSAA